MRGVAAENEVVIAETITTNVWAFAVKTQNGTEEGLGFRV